MSDQNLIVSANRLEAIVAKAQGGGGLESTESVSGPEATAADLAKLTGATRIDPTPPTELQRTSIEMQYARSIELLREAELHPGVMCATEDQIAALLQTALADASAEDQQKIKQAIGGGLEATFDERDVRWVLSLVTWVGKLNPHDWLPIPKEPEKLPNGKFKIAVMGDWGTGLYGGPQCADSIKKQGKFAYVVHLGDVYYSGTTKESKANFLDKWPRVPGAVSRACNGNHEMYSGGYGYFDVILPDFGQKSSCFAMKNDDWLIVGLDSAYADHDLWGEQNAWLSHLIDKSNGARVILFTHHQPFSHFDHGGDKLVAKLLPLLLSKKITAWYWGHEHRCVIYNQHPQWGVHGRCIGHSGYPYFNKPSRVFPKLASPAPQRYAFFRDLPPNSVGGVPRAKLLDGTNPTLAKHAEDYGPNGYLTLEFDGPKLTERYFLSDEHATPIAEVTL